MTNPTFDLGEFPASAYEAWLASARYYPNHSEAAYWTWDRAKQVLASQASKESALLDEALKALEFYANIGTYVAYDNLGYGDISLATADSGGTASEAIAKIKKARGE